jgi:hypothetical protein
MDWSTMGARGGTARRSCDLCGAMVPPGRSGIIYPLHTAVWNFLHPDPADERRMLHSCSDQCSWDLGRELGRQLARHVRAERRRARRHRTTSEEDE